MRTAEEFPADAGAGSENRRYVQVFQQAKAERAWPEGWEEPVEPELLKMCLLSTAVPSQPECPAVFVSFL